MPNGEIDAFITRHGMVQMIADEHGFKGECTTSDEILERAGISEGELKLHQDLFVIDDYTVEAISRTHCTRDSLRVLSERLESALK